MDNYLDYIKNKLKDNFDVKYRTTDNVSGKITLIFIDNLCDSKFISEYIMAPLVLTEIPIDNIQVLETKILYSNILGPVKSYEDALIHILSGDVVIVFDYINDAMFCEAKGFAKRSVTVPQTEAVVKGPREGFTESLVDNVSMIRRKVKNSNMKIETFVVGKRSNTTVAVSYIEGVAPRKLVDEVKGKISSSKQNFILESNYIQELFQSNKSSFDTVSYTEKPDVVASKIMEGRVAVIVDGSPFVISLPGFFLENFHTGDDYYANKFLANSTRLLRWGAYFIATFLFGIYVAIVTYHFSLIPSVFVFRLSVARAGVPFPTVVEVILMITFFQIIREAGLRLPQPIGQAMSIVGALILGDAAIGAGLTSEITVFIVALGSISFFLIPKLAGPTYIWSVILILFGAFLGLPGFYVGFFMLVTHLAGLESCGYPYLFPLGTLKNLKYKDIFYRDDLSTISKDLFDEGDDS
jgi:spore germination protein